MYGAAHRLSCRPASTRGATLGCGQDGRRAERERVARRNNRNSSRSVSLQHPSPRRRAVVTLRAGTSLANRIVIVNALQPPDARPKNRMTRQRTTGFNDNVEYRGRVYHVQTEHAGARVTTHVFHGGTIIATASTAHAPETPPDGVVELSRASQRKLRDALLGGSYDERIDSLFGAPAESPAAEAGSADDAVLEQLLALEDPPEDESEPPPSTVERPGTVPPPSLVDYPIDTRLRPDLVLPILLDIERRAGTGALHFHKQGRLIGKVLVERGAVCWAHAERMGARLYELLQRTTVPPLSSAALARSFRSARERNEPLVRVLGECGLSAGAIRKSWLQHSAEALVRLAAAGATTTFVAHEGDHWGAAETFAPLEIYVATAALRNRALAAAARRMLSTCLNDPAVAGIAFAGDRDARLVLAVRGPVSTLAEAQALAGDAVASLSAARAIDPASYVVFKRAASGAALCAWRDGALSLAALCPDLSSLGFLLAARASLK
jgi:hypothetical protein